MKKLGVTHIQAALGLMAAIKDEGVEKALEQALLKAEEVNEEIERISGLRKQAEELSKEATRVIKENGDERVRLVKVEQGQKELASSLEKLSNDLKAEREYIEKSLKVDDERSRSNVEETAKALASAKRARTNAANLESKSAEIRDELETRKSRLDAAMA